MKYHWFGRRNRGIGFLLINRSSLGEDLGWVHVVVEPCTRAWSFGDAGSDWILKLDLDSTSTSSRFIII